MSGPVPGALTQATASGQRRPGDRSRRPPPPGLHRPKPTFPERYDVAVVRTGECRDSDSRILPIWRPALPSIAVELVHRSERRDMPKAGICQSVGAVDLSSAVSDVTGSPGANCTGE